MYNAVIQLFITLVAACKGVSRPRPHCTSEPGGRQEAVLKFPPKF